MKKVMFVFGTRPEAVKMAPLVKELQKQSDNFKTIVCVTGQHREMLDQVLTLFNIIPDYDLHIMKEGQDLYDITSRILLGLRDILKFERPDIILVHGDTTTSTSSALAAFYQKIAVGHVEAGLRTYDVYSPWPEEMNRQITGRIATYHFCPTELSRTNLLSEGVDEKNIFVTGNTVIDALHSVLEKIKEDNSIRLEVFHLLGENGISESMIESWQVSRKLVLITGHRRENFGEGFINICNAIKSLAAKYSDVDFVYPMHLNPNVRTPIYNVFGNNYKEEFPNVFFVEPLDYLPFVYIMQLSTIILTDSGGIQEEAPSLGKPVLVMRNTTERPEALKAGTVKLVGTSYDNILLNVSLLLDNEVVYENMSKAQNPYGQGNSRFVIADILNKL